MYLKRFLFILTIFHYSLTTFYYKNMTPLFETERLNIYPVTIDDAPFILKLLNTKGWLQFIGDRGVRTLEDAQNQIRDRYLKHYDEHGFGIYTVFLKSENVPTGVVTLLRKPYLDAEDIGYAFLDEYHGKGYALEAAQSLLKYARTDLGLNKIVAVTNLDNERSMKLLQKMGFQFEKIIVNEGQELNVFSI